MKREFISQLIPDIPKETLDALMAEHGKSIEAEKAKLTTANETIRNLQTAAKKYEGVDVEGLKTQMATLQTKYDNDISELRLNSALDIALGNAKAKNPKAIKGLLTMDSIKLDGDKLLGLDTQLEALKQSDSYLFDSTPVVKTGMRQLGTETTNNTKDEANAAFRAAFGRETT